MYRFPWYLTLVSTNHASNNPGQIILFAVIVNDILVLTVCMRVNNNFFGGKHYILQQVTAVIIIMLKI